MLAVNQVSVQFKHSLAVNQVSLSLKLGEISCLLGPSGCGKTTLLRAIAGFIKINSGTIILNDQTISKKNTLVPPEKRNIGMVFQDFALFPHLTLKQNIGFGIQKWRKKSREERIKKMLVLVSMVGFENRYPHELSGGQQQRIAIARAIAPKPKILLLDEPFSSLDIELRQELAIEIKNILQQENITSLMVTHDQREAFSISQNIGVMNEGRLLQWDKSYVLYHQPKNSFVADFIGEGTLIDGIVTSNNQVKTNLMMLEGKVPTGCRSGTKVKVLIRPDDIVHDDCSPMSAIITNKIFRGSHHLYALKTTDGTKLLSMVHSHHNHKIGEKLGIVLEMEHLVVFAQHHTN